MNGFINFPHLVSTTGAVSLMRSDNPTLPPFAVLLDARCGEVLDTFTDRHDADEFYTDAQDRIRKGLPWPDPDAPAVSDINPDAIVDWATAKVSAEPVPALLPCGCYDGACFCGQYPTDAEWSAMQAEAEADLPERIPLTLEEEQEAEELRNFFGGRHDQ